MSKQKEQKRPQYNTADTNDHANASAAQDPQGVTQSLPDPVAQGSAIPHSPGLGSVSYAVPTTAPMKSAVLIGTVISNNGLLHEINARYKELMDMVESIPDKDSFVARWKSLAITNLEQSYKNVSDALSR